MVTIYSKPNCQPCRATYRSLDKHGVSYEVIDISEDHDARDWLIAEGHQQTPVVVSPIGTWSGYYPDKIKALAQA